MASSTLDFLVDEHELTAPIPGARFVHAGTLTTSAPHVVHGTMPVHAPVAVPQSTPTPPSPGPGAPSSPSTGATALCIPHRLLLVAPRLHRRPHPPVLLPLCHLHGLLPAAPRCPSAP
jgi:hypothetical protein